MQQVALIQATVLRVSCLCGVRMSEEGDLRCMEAVVSYEHNKCSKKGQGPIKKLDLDHF